MAEAGIEYQNKITLDLSNPDNPRNKKIMEYNYNPKNLIKKLEEKLNEAVQQYNSLIKYKPEYRPYPFVVVICKDFYAEILNLYNPKRILNNLQEISALIRLEKNYEGKQVQQKHLKELNEYYRKYRNRNKKTFTEKLGKNWGKDYEGIPDTVRFMVWLNSRAKIKFKQKEFFRNPIINYL